jgi:hypothetical protein
MSANETSRKLNLYKVFCDLQKLVTVEFNESELKSENDMLAPRNERRKREMMAHSRKFLDFCHFMKDFWFVNPGNYLFIKEGPKWMNM